MSEWITWTSKTKPVDYNVVVDIMCRNGEEDTAVAGTFDWTQDGSLYDIVAWRIHQEVLKVGDQVTSSGNYHGTIIAIHKDSAWVDFDDDINMSTRSLDSLKKFEKPIQVGDKVHYVDGPAYVKAIDGKHAWISGKTYATVRLDSLQRVDDAV